MYALVGEKWADLWLDEVVGARSARLAVTEWVNLRPVRGGYFERAASARYLLGQFRRLGPMDLLRKVRSRMAERGRNERWVAVGVGRVTHIGADVPARFLGATVTFVAPRHPAGMERVVLDVALCEPVQGELLPAAPSVAGTAIAHARDRPLGVEVEAAIADLEGWLPHSGTPAPVAAVAACRQTISRAWSYRRYAGSADVAVRRGASPSSNRPRLAVVGYGNYAKTVAVPQLSSTLELAAVCDLDPFQMPQADSSRIWSTSFAEIGDDEFDVVLAAGFHHTHVDVAIRALRAGKDVIVEKPIFTTEAQALSLQDAIASSSGRIFFGFQRRYSPFGIFIEQDLRGSAPRDYHCVVFEEPLPALHWYRWPASGGRMLSNGCHWIDHFLLLNGNSPVEAQGSLHHDEERAMAWIRLANDAIMTMSLTSAGSARLGMRDYIEIRSGKKTVKITDSSRYESENSDRTIRRKRCAPLAAHRAMYADFAQRISTDAAGDSYELALASGLASLRAAQTACD